MAAIANIISLVAFMSLGGRVVMGWLADLFPRKYVMILIYLLVGGSIPLLLMPEFPGRLYIFAVVFGLGLGGDYMIIPLMAGDLFEALQGIPTATLEEKRQCAALVLNHPVSPAALREKVRKALADLQQK